MKDDPDLLALGREARRLREARDLTQEELADRAGLHPNYTGRIERGESNVGVKALFKLARGLEVEPAALFGQLAFTTQYSELNRRQVPSPKK